MKKYFFSLIAIVFLFFSALGAFVNILFSQYLTQIVDIISAPTVNIRLILVLSLLYVVLLIVYYLGLSIAKSKFMSSVSKKMKLDLMESYFSQSYNEVQKNHASISSLLVNDTQFLIDNYFLPIGELFSALIQILLAVVIISQVSVGLTLFILVMSVIGSFIPRKLSKGISIANKEYLETQGRYLAVLNDYFSKFKTIIQTHSQKHFQNDLSQQTTLLTDKLYISKHKHGNSVAFLNILNMTTTIVVIVIMATLVIRGDMEIATFVGFVYLVNNLVSPIYYSATLLNNINASQSVKNNIEDIIAQKNITKQIENDASFSHNQSPLVLDNLQYSFKDRTIINNFSFSFEPHQKYLLTGESGSGKSTFFKLLMKEIIDYKGAIHLFGTELKTIHETDLHRYIFYASQEPVMFPGTIFDNLTLFGTLNSEQLFYYIDKIDLKKYKEVLKTTTIDTLSGGEKQRVAIIRSLLSDAPILLYDESTSNQDQLRAGFIEEAMLETDKTIIYISHKIEQSMKDKFDYILNISNGTIEVS